MSSIQHQLIEQCATRLRGIVEALNNIHDTSPHRWSTDLDDVHSSAESLLAMIKDQASNQADLAQPSPKCTTCNGTGQIVVSGPHYCGELQPPECETEPCDMCSQPSPAQPEGAPVIGCLCGMPMTEGHHSPDGCCNLEEFAPQAQAEQAEAERPEVVGVRYEDGTILSAEDCGTALEVCAKVQTPLMTVAQHERIVGALRAENAKLSEALDRWPLIRDILKLRLADAQARVAALTATRNRYGVDAHYFNKNLQRILRDFESFTPDELARSLIILAKVADEKVVAQHSVPELDQSRSALTEAQMRRIYENSTEAENERLGFAAFARLMRRAEAVHQIAAAPGKEVPQAWLDVQAERKRQVEVEGWTPEHDDKHNGGELADAAACYALWAGGINPGNWREFWPWAPEWLRHSEPRRMLVKAGALILAEIERLDRAAVSQGGPSDA